MMKVVILSLLFACAFGQDCFSRGANWWTFGLDEACQESAACIETGTTVDYQWSGTHTVYSMNNAADFASCTLAGEVCSGMEMNTCSETFNTPGLYYRGCSVPGHCPNAGMKIAFTVQDSCAPPSPPSPPPTPPPTSPPPPPPSSEDSDFFDCSVFGNFPPLCYQDKFMYHFLFNHPNVVTSLSRDELETLDMVMNQSLSKEVTLALKPELSTVDSAALGLRSSAHGYYGEGYSSENNGYYGGENNGYYGGENHGYYGGENNGHESGYYGEGYSGENNGHHGHGGDIGGEQGYIGPASSIYGPGELGESGYFERGYAGVSHPNGGESGETGLFLVNDHGYKEHGESGPRCNEALAMFNYCVHCSLFNRFGFPAQESLARDLYLKFSESC